MLTTHRTIRTPNRAKNTNAIGKKFNPTPILSGDRMSFRRGEAVTKWRKAIKKIAKRDRLKNLPELLGRALIIQLLKKINVTSKHSLSIPRILTILKH